MVVARRGWCADGLGGSCGCPQARFVVSNLAREGAAGGPSGAPGPVSLKDLALGRSLCLVTGEVDRDYKAGHPEHRDHRAR